MLVELKALEEFVLLKERPIGTSMDMEKNFQAKQKISWLTFYLKELLLEDYSETTYKQS